MLDAHGADCSPAQAPDVNSADLNQCLRPVD